VKNNTHVKDGPVLDVQWSPAEHISGIETQVTDRDAARSARNISLWMSYLPKDCVKTMIRMGWDQTT
jgi:hypothetical protein